MSRRFRLSCPTTDGTTKIIFLLPYGPVIWLVIEPSNLISSENSWGIMDTLGPKNSVLQGYQIALSTKKFASISTVWIWTKVSCTSDCPLISHPLCPWLTVKRYFLQMQNVFLVIFIFDWFGTNKCSENVMMNLQAEILLVRNGDFLVRESTNTTGQYVLSGMQNGKIKHLLLVDPDGQVCPYYPRNHNYIANSNHSVSQIVMVAPFYYCEKFCLVNSTRM